MPRGEPRPGAGRPEGSRNRFGEADRRCLGELAAKSAEEALAVLLDVARNAKSELDRVAAAREPVSLAYGRDPVRAGFAAPELEPPALPLLALLEPAACDPELPDHGEV